MCLFTLKEIFGLKLTEYRMPMIIVVVFIVDVKSY